MSTLLITAIYSIVSSSSSETDNRNRRVNRERSSVSKWGQAIPDSVILGLALVGLVTCVFLVTMLRHIPSFDFSSQEQFHKGLMFIGLGATVFVLAYPQNYQDEQFQAFSRPDWRVPNKLSQ